MPAAPCFFALKLLDNLGSAACRPYPSPFTTAKTVRSFFRSPKQVLQNTWRTLVSVCRRILGRSGGGCGALDTAHQWAGMLASNAAPDKQRVVADLIERVVVSNENMQIRIRGHRFVGATLPQQATSDVAFSIGAPFIQPAGAGLTKLPIEERASRYPDPVITKAADLAHRWFEELN
jgi:hypothetical protein